MRIALATLALFLFAVPATSFADMPAAEQAAISAGMTASQAAQIDWASPTISSMSCIAVTDTTCFCGQIKNPNGGGCIGGANKYLCPCADPRGVTGICMPGNKCMAVSAAGLGGGQSGVGASSMSSLLQAVGQMLGQMMSGSGSGGSGGDSGSGSTNATTCPNGYYQSSVQTSDPCAYYVPSTVPTSTIDTTSQDLLNSLGQTGSSTIDTSGINLNGNLTSTANITGTFQAPNSQTGTTTPGLSGGIQTTGTGATFVANNIQSNTETSAFFGGDTIGGFVSNLIGCLVYRQWYIPPLRH